MAHVTADRVLQLCTPVATSQFTLGAAVAGFRGVAAIPGIVTNDTLKYSAWGVDANGTPTGDWENGIGTYNSTTGTVARTTIISSSNANTAVTFTATTVYLANSLLSSHTTVQDDTGKVTLNAATTARAGLTLPHGTAPTAPVNGDVWTTTAGAFVQVNGATQQLPTPATAAPGAIAATGAVGTGTTYARNDHTHAGVASITTSSGLSANTNATGAVSITNTGVTSVAFNGGAATTGAVSITAREQAVTTTARSGDISTTVTAAVTYNIAANSIAAGSSFYVRCFVLASNTATATNLVATLVVGATTIATLTQALGTTARTTQPALIEGVIHFTAATTAEGFVRAFTSSAVAFDSIASNTTAVTVVTNTATTAALNLSVSGASSKVNVLSATIERLK